jgi:hypothetical protein
LFFDNYRLDQKETKTTRIKTKTDKDEDNYNGDFRRFNSR